MERLIVFQGGYVKVKHVFKGLFSFLVILGIAEILTPICGYLVFFYILAMVTGMCNNFLIICK